MLKPKKQTKKTAVFNCPSIITSHYTTSTKAIQWT